MANYIFTEVPEEEYRSLALKSPDATFYNTKERFSFLKSQKRKLAFYKIESAKKVVALLQYQHINAKSGSFLYFQHSPLFLDKSVAEDAKLWEELELFAKDLAKKLRVLYVRFTPRIESSDKLREIVEQGGFEKAPVQEVDASVTRIVDLENFSEKQLSTEITEQLKLAKAAELSFKVLDTNAGLEEFLMLYKTVMSKSETFVIPIDYMKAELETYLASKILLTGLSYDAQGALYSACIVILDDATAWYYWTVTNEKGAKNGSHAFMLENMIIELKKRGFKTLDLWGESVPTEVIKRKLPHPWIEIDKFKQGFGTKLVEYLPPIDIPVQTALYRASCLYQRFNMSRRGYPFIGLDLVKNIAKK